MSKSHFLFFNIIGWCLTIWTTHGQSLQVAGVSDPAIWMYAGEPGPAATVLEIRGLSDEAKHFPPSKALNFHPTFNVSKVAVSGLSLDLNTATVFCVVQPNTGGEEEAIWQFERGTKPTVMATSHRMADLNNYQFINLLNRSRTKPYFANYFQHLNRQDSAASFSFVLAPDPRDIPIGRLQSGIAEVIVFDRVISPKEKSIIDSYLSIKYAIPLQQVVPTHYYNADHFIIWDAKRNRSYPNEVVAIGRSDHVGLNQKQTSSQVLSMSAGQQSSSNATNPTLLPDNAFIFWSHNGKSLTWLQDNDKGLRRLERSWLAVVDDSMHAITTQIILHKEHLGVEKSPDEIWWLDRYPEQADQLLAQLEAIPFESVPSGAEVIDDILWDQDHSGDDLFMISAGPPFRVEYQISESNCERDEATVALKVFGGEAPYSIRMLQRDGSQILTDLTEESFVELKGLRAGAFRLLVTDQNNRAFQKELQINHLDAEEITLPNQFNLDDKEILVIDPLQYLSVPLAAEITWILPNQDQIQQPVLQTNSSGMHTLVISTDGCRSAHRFEILKSTNEIIKEVTLFPNPIAVGSTIKAQIDLKLPASVHIELVSAAGQIIQQWVLNGKKEYWVEHRILVAGNYFLNVRSLQKNKSTPFVVQ